MKRYLYHLDPDEGGPYMPGRTTWPEHVEYSGFRHNAHWFRMFLGNLVEKEIEDVRRGEAEFGLYVEEDVILLLYRFGTSVPWGDAPYSIHLARPEEREVPGLDQPLGPEDPVVAVLVEATTGIVQAVREVWLPAEFTSALRSALRRQARRPWPGEESYNRQVQEIYRRYPNPGALLKRAVARATGRS